MARVLVLDDDVVSGRLIAQLLRKRGHEVHVCAKSIDAWRRLDSSPVDIMILDTELEGEYGWDVLEGIRGDVIFKTLSVVVCSSNSRRDVVKRYLDLGVQAIVIKPYSAERINQEVERAVANPWRSHLFESAESVLLRTGLTSGGLSRLYRDAAEQIEAALSDLQALREEPANATGLARLAALRSCGVNVGFKLLATIAEEGRKLAGNSDQENFGFLLDRLPVAKRLLEIQAGDDQPAPEAELADAGAEAGSNATGG
ncbi:MAG: response regulator [Opitutaceae bacterium]